MKKIILPLILALLVSLPSTRAHAQDDRYMMYLIHEDHVSPSMLTQYEQTTKELVDNAKKYNVPGTRWITAQTSDFRYLYVVPISKMGDLDDNSFWTTLRGKMGAEKFDDMFSRMDKCYDVHTNYILRLDKELSYMPGGLTQTPEGKNYRRFFYVHTTPGNESKLEASMKNVKELFQKKGSKMEYRVYRSGFGSGGTYFMVAIAAKDGTDYETMDAANNQLLGTDARDVFGNMMQYVSRFEEVSGMMRPDLAYAPKE